MNPEKKILVQCDFDGTVTIDDASFAILDAYLPYTWEKLFKKHKEGLMTVGEFNDRAFSQVKADKETLLKLIDTKINIRPGFVHFVSCCRKKGYPLVIVSNGLDFYIEHLLKKAGLSDIEFHASITTFTDDGLSLRHKGPDGEYINDEVKTAYAESFVKAGYEIVYLGDGTSDLSPAMKSSHIFATGSLVDCCIRNGVKCMPFDDFFEVIIEMESWS